MSVSYVDATYNGAGAAGSVGLTKPTGQDGDIFIIFWTSEGSGSPTISGETGWNFVWKSDGAHARAVMWKKITDYASEPSTYNVEGTGSYEEKGVLLCVRPTDGEVPTVVNAHNGEVSSSAYVIPALASSEPCYAFYSWTSDNTIAGSTPPTGWTERLDVADTQGQIYLMSKDASFTGYLDSADWTLGGNPVQAISNIVGLSKPPAATTPVTPTVKEVWNSGATSNQYGPFVNLVVDPNNGDWYMWRGSSSINSYLYRSTDQGGNWTQLSSASVNLSTQYIRPLEATISPNGHLYVQGVDNATADDWFIYVYEDVSTLTGTANTPDKVFKVDVISASADVWRMGSGLQAVTHPNTAEDDMVFMLYKFTNGSSHQTRFRVIDYDVSAQTFAENATYSISGDATEVGMWKADMCFEHTGDGLTFTGDGGKVLVMSQTASTSGDPDYGWQATTFSYTAAGNTWASDGTISLKFNGNYTTDADHGGIWCWYDSVDSQFCYVGYAPHASSDLLSFDIRPNATTDVWPGGALNSLFIGRYNDVTAGSEDWEVVRGYTHDDRSGSFWQLGGLWAKRGEGLIWHSSEGQSTSAPDRYDKYTWDLSSGAIPFHAGELSYDKPAVDLPMVYPFAPIYDHFNGVFLGFFPATNTAYGLPSDSNYGWGFYQFGSVGGAAGVGWGWIPIGG